jgi:hypothetical protein
MPQAAWLLGSSDVVVALYSGMIGRWLAHANDHGGWRIPIPSPAFVPRQRYAVSSVIRRPASSPLPGAQKNTL